MHLAKIDVVNFRSIKKASVKPSRGVTTFIGANNEGKSNFLKAVKFGLSVLENVQYFRMQQERGSIRLRKRSDLEGYSWEDDFPVGMQENSRKGETEIRFEFIFSSREVEEFREEFGISINGKIPVKLILGRRSFKLEIPKQGQARPAFERNGVAIAKFLSKRLRFVYIPAIRTAESANQIIDKIISERVRQVELPILAKVESQLRQVRAKAFERIEGELEVALKSFLPDIKGIRVSDFRAPRRVRDYPDYLVEIDDGNLTALHRKGDGVQSLATLALMRSQGSETDHQDIIYAIEEPEAHLHSDAIHKVRSVIDGKSEGNQLFITTHSAIFVQRKSISENIIVDASEARPAKNTDEIRSVLGIRPPENLISASAVLLCEGELDCNFIREYLSCRGGEASKRIASGDLSVVDIDGAGNLEFYVKHYLSLACEVYAFVDNDQQGRQSVDKITHRNLLPSRNIRFTTSSVRSTSELEDLYDQTYVDKYISDAVRVDKKFREHPACFSVRLRDLYKRKGRVLSAKDLHGIKIGLQSEGFEKIAPSDEETIEALDDIEFMLSKMNS